jgi:hypothetical protein
LSPLRAPSAHSIGVQTQTRWHPCSRGPRTRRRTGSTCAPGTCSWGSGSICAVSRSAWSRGTACWRPSALVRPPVLQCHSQACAPVDQRPTCGAVRPSEGGLLGPVGLVVQVITGQPSRAGPIGLLLHWVTAAATKGVRGRRTFRERLEETRRIAADVRQRQTADDASRAAK